MDSADVLFLNAISFVDDSEFVDDDADSAVMGADTGSDSEKGVGICGVFNEDVNFDFELGPYFA